VPASSARRAFTLIEMLVVIAIIGVVAAISVPALKNIQKSDAQAAATRLILDSVARARQFAISQRSTVCMVFAPADFWNVSGYAQASAQFTPQERFAITNLLSKQLVAYNFVSVRSVGDQPGRGQPRYLDEWRTMPEGTFVPLFKFYPPVSGYTRISDPAPPLPVQRQVDVYGFLTNSIPFPLAESPTTFPVPCIVFNHLGQLDSPRDEEIIPLARGTVAPALDPVNKRPVFGLPSMTERPAGNSTNAFTFIVIDRLTGRARVERQQIQ
jgi:prepilin-type N-terminal cleavage/methylation domain-containing protein